MLVRPLVRRLAVALTFGAAACQDAPTAPTARPTAPVGGVSGVQALTCTVDVHAHTVGCSPAASATTAAAANADGLHRTLVFGNQGVYVRLDATASAPPSGDSLSVPVTVQNLLAQPLGTTDGVTYDGHGVMVFFAQAPATTSGSGTVTVLNPDTTGTFTASGQQGFVYPQFLAGNQTSAVRNWIFSVPSSVGSFRFTVFVRAQLPNELAPLAAQPAHVFSTTADAGLVGGLYHTCGLRPGAGVYCWGGTGIPGNGGTISDSTSGVPLLVPGSAGAVALAAGSSADHVCWLRSGGTAACVGHDEFGQLGDGMTPPAPVLTAHAVQMPAGVSAFSQMTLGIQHTCALTSAGAAYCWGFNGLGQLGDGTRTDEATAVAVLQPAGVQFTRIAAGQLHTCALSTAGAVYCWGYNGTGQLGNAVASGTDTAAAVAVPLPAGVTLTRIAAGAGFTCGLAASGAAYCWGDNSSGQLGDGTQISRATASAVQRPSGVTFSQLVVGGSHACALGSNGVAYCWGEGADGELGDNQFTMHLVPTAALALGAGVRIAQLAAGTSHSCALAATGAAYCWGSNYLSQIGDGTGTDRGAPTAVWMP